MNSVVATVISFLTAAGIGGAIGAYFQLRFQLRAQIGQQQHDLKQKRYLSTLILMLAKLYPDVDIPNLRELRQDLRSLEDIDHELAREMFNGFIFASDGVLESLAAFIEKPDYRSFVRAVGAMRKDLWGKRTTIKEDTFDVVALLQKPASISADRR